MSTGLTSSELREIADCVDALNSLQSDLGCVTLSGFVDVKDSDSCEAGQIRFINGVWQHFA